MNHARNVAVGAAGTVLAALGHPGWSALCAVAAVLIAGIVIILWVLSGQARSDRAIALVSAWRGINKPDPVPPGSPGESAIGPGRSGSLRIGASHQDAIYGWAALQPAAATENTCQCSSDPFRRVGRGRTGG
jgi:hypothetical protein